MCESDVAALPRSRTRWLLRCYPVQPLAPFPGQLWRASAAPAEVAGTRFVHSADDGPLAPAPRSYSAPKPCPGLQTADVADTAPVFDRLCALLVEVSRVGLGPPRQSTWSPLMSPTFRASDQVSAVDCRAAQFASLRKRRAGIATGTEDDFVHSSRSRISCASCPTRCSQQWALDNRSMQNRTLCSVARSTLCWLQPMSVNR